MVAVQGDEFSELKIPVQYRNENRKQQEVRIMSGVKIWEENVVIPT